MPELAQNPPYKRFQHIAKLYGDKHPEVVLDTFWVLADTVGIENPASRFDFAKTWRYVADPVVGRSDLRRAMMAHGVGQSASVAATELRHPVVAADVLNSAMEELAEAPEMKRGRESDALWPWVARELVLAKKEALSQEVAPGVWDPPIDVWPYLQALNALQDKGSALALWQRQERIDLGKWHLYDVMDALEGFEVSRRGVSQGEVLYRWPDGWTMQKLVSQEQLDAEGEVMQHCVGTYCEALDTEGPVDILSLRDPSGNPHATIEYNEEINRFVQVQGKQNQEPLPEYMARVQEFAKWKGVLPIDELSRQEQTAIREYVEQVTADAWGNSLDRHDFSIVGSEVNPVTFEWHDVVEVAFPRVDTVSYEGLEELITEYADEVSDRQWHDIHGQAMHALETAVAEAIEEVQEEEDPDVDDVVSRALDSMEWDWGNDDFVYAVEIVRQEL